MWARTNRFVGIIRHTNGKIHLSSCHYCTSLGVFTREAYTVQYHCILEYISTYFEKCRDNRQNQKASHTSSIYVYSDISIYYCAESNVCKDVELNKSWTLSAKYVKLMIRFGDVCKRHWTQTSPAPRLQNTCQYRHTLVTSVKNVKRNSSRMLRPQKTPN